MAKVPEPTVVALLQDVKVVSVHLGVLLEAGAAHVIKLPTVAQPDVGCGFSLSIKSSMAFKVDSVAWKAKLRSYVLAAILSSEFTSLIAVIPKIVITNSRIRLITNVTPDCFEGLLII